MNNNLEYYTLREDIIDEIIKGGDKNIFIAEGIMRGLRLEEVDPRHTPNMMAHRIIEMLKTKYGLDIPVDENR